MAKTNISILKYNNYFNRKVLYPTQYEIGNMPLSAYTSTTQYHEEFLAVNFYKADGVNATLVLNTLKESCDYLVEYEINADQTTHVLSRWFIVEAMQTRLGQYELTLRRDLLVDYYDSYKDAPVYIEKAKILDTTDIAIYNKEDISFNQIKSSEKLLKKNTDVPWIVGYMDINSEVKDTDHLIIPVDEINLYGTYNTWEEFYASINYNNASWKYTNNYNIQVYAFLNPSLNVVGRAAVYKLGSYNTINGDGQHLIFQNVQSGERKPLMNEVNTYLYANKDTITTLRNVQYQDIHDNSPYFLENKYISVAGNIYKLNVNVLNNGSQIHTKNEIPVNSSIWNEICSLLSTKYGSKFRNDGIVATSSVFNEFDYVEYTIGHTPATLSEVQAIISKDSNRLVDAPYKMFAIPADSITVIDSGATTFTTITKDTALAVGSYIATKLNASCYDVQLLPYCPWSSLLNESGNLSLNGLVENHDFDYINSTESTPTKKGVIIYPKKASFTLDIDIDLSVSTTVEDLKIANQCDKYRLCSPNYSAAFEFNIVKTGNISKFNIDCTYKPYNPYIHINPVWSKLYGQDYNDTRGLICQGEFSIPVMNSKWEEFQINNKNYLNAFNREIESIEKQTKFSEISDFWGALTGSATGAASGAAIGMMSGGPFGAIVGAAGGLAASGAAGITDIMMNKQLRAEALDLKKDQFNYSLQNIQALPKTLAKISSYDYNNKIFPVLEYYTCTEEEKEIFKNKMKYNGMKIMRIDTINNFKIPSVLTYIKGKVIQLPDLADDYHVAVNISDELNQGAWI